MIHENMKATVIQIQTEALLKPHLKQAVTCLFGGKLGGGGRMEGKYLFWFMAIPNGAQGYSEQWLEESK